MGLRPSRASASDGDDGQATENDMTRSSLLIRLFWAALATGFISLIPSGGLTSRVQAAEHRQLAQTAQTAYVLYLPILTRGAEGAMPPPAPAASNPFGVMLGLTNPQNQTVVQNLGAGYFRPSMAITIEGWNGLCEQCEIARQLGLKLILTVRYNGGANTPTTPPTDLEAYQATLDQILEAYAPQVLIVENEENSRLFYAGTPAEYGLQLTAACEVAHRRQLTCANGGLVSSEVALLVWEHYRSQGQHAAACSFATRAFEPVEAQGLCALQNQPQLPEPLAELIAKGQALLEVYRTAGMDYLNFHWYIPNIAAQTEAAHFLRSQVGLPLMTNEMGQHDDDPTTVQALMQNALELDLAYAIWFSVDTPQARALQNTDGSLRPTGEVFRNFVRANSH